MAPAPPSLRLLSTCPDTSTHTQRPRCTPLTGKACGSRQCGPARSSSLPATSSRSPRALSLATVLLAVSRRLSPPFPEHPLYTPSPLTTCTQSDCTAPTVPCAEAAPDTAPTLCGPAPNVRAQQRRDPGHHAHPAPRVPRPPHPHQQQGQGERRQDRSTRIRSSRFAPAAMRSRGTVHPALRQGPQPPRQHRGRHPPSAPPAL